MQITLFDSELSEEIAQSLLDVEAIKLQPDNPFTWASGWKSPIYCDNRVSLSFPETRTKIKEALVRLIKAEYPEAEAVAGVATAGIPQGALVAEALGLPFIYVRSKSKGHGLTNQIEGKVVKGQKVVVLEDLVSTGGSSLAAVDALNDAGVDVFQGDDLGFLDISYAGIKAREYAVLSYLKNLGIPVATVIGGGYDRDKQALAERHALVIEQAHRVYSG